ncbi:MAG: hypothetical protein HYV34_00630 [Candidatus Kerfeldbacteria bacterium]|nr:hypothetical protein [Candidatus Kerfeldbacteria bacterium]
MDDHKPEKMIQLKGHDGKGVVHWGKRLYIGTVNIFLPPLAHFHTGRYIGKKHHYVLDTFLAMLMFVLLGAGIYFRAQIRRLFIDDIHVTATPSLLSPIGQDETGPFTAGRAHRFPIVLTNDSGHVLTNVEIRIIPDDGSATPDSQQLSTHADELARDEQQTMSVQLTPYGMINESREVKTIITYDDQGSRRGQTTTLSFPVLATDLAMRIDALQTVAGNQYFDVTITPVRGSFVDNETIEIESSAEANFSKKNTDVDHKASDVKIQARMNDDVVGEHTLTVTARVRVNDKAIVIDRQILPLTVVRPEAKLTLALSDDTIEVGASTTASMTITNTGEHTLRNVVMSCLGDGDTKMTFRGDGGVATNHGISFSYTTLSELADLAAGASLARTFSFTPQTLGLNGTVSLSCSATAEQRADNTETPITVYTAPRSLTVVPAISFATYALYTDVGAGPIPPEVGTPTLYRVVMEVANFENVRSFTVTALLPSAVLFAGNPSSLAGGAPAFDAQTRTITWNVPSTPDELETISASFDVQLIPTTAHKGTAPTLLGEATLRMNTDQGTRSSTTPAITTNLTKDPALTGKGVVK